MNLSVFLMLLLAVSIFTGLVTEAVKKWMLERDKKYHANTLTGYVAAILAVAASVAYVILAEIRIDVQMAVYFVALVFLSWLSAMVGYDKVMQAISQLQVYGAEKTDKRDMMDKRNMMDKPDMIFQTDETDKAGETGEDDTTS